MNMKRRTFLKGAATSGMLGVALSAGLITPRRVLAIWPKSAFESKDANDALKLLLGTDSYTPSNAITFTDRTPNLAENGQVVPIEVQSTLSNVESISIIAEKNPVPLVASFKLGASTEPYVNTRIKMAATSNVIAIVKSDGKLYSAKKKIKVTIGGCGG
jgi:sulfur-oxidizing protein SoxY